MTRQEFFQTGRVQFITHCTERYTYADSARLALDGGCRWIQLRMKNRTEHDIETVAMEIMPLCRMAGATFIIDDHVELAFRIGADGVHLGRHDMPVDEARRITSSQFIIGGTANTIEDVERLARQGADYIGCGPFRFTTTKKNLSPILGLEGYRSIVSGMNERGITQPIVAIGGITCGDISGLMATGVGGIAISGGVLRAGKPVEEMRKIVTKINAINL